MPIKNSKAKVIAIISLAVSSSLYASTNNKSAVISCNEFINLEPEAMTPVSTRILNEELKYKGGDTVSLSELSETYLPEIIKECKQSPSLKVSDVVKKIRSS